MAPLTVERRPLGALTAAERERWRALAARAVEANPFLEPELLVPAAAHLEGGERVELLVVRDGDRWRGCLAVRTQPKWSSLWLPCVRSWRNPYGFLDTPLVDRDAVGPACAAIARASAAWPGRAFLVVEHAADGPVAEALLAAAPTRPRSARPFAFERVERAALRRRPEDDYVRGFVSGKRRRELGRTRRLLERETGGAVALVDATGDGAALDRFLVLESGGWKGQAGTALASRPGHERFLREAVAGFAADGRIRLLELHAGERTVAALLCVVADRTLYTLKIGYDETLGAGAPGILLLVDVASWFHAQPDLDAVDSCASPDHPTINRLWPDRRGIVTPVLPAAGVGGRLTVTIDRRRRAAEETS